MDHQKQKGQKEQKGYDKDRFPKLQDEIFDCLICHCVARNPKQCNECGFIFCNLCISGWFQRKKTCPNKCNGEIEFMKNKALMKMYKRLDIRCIICQEIVKLLDLQKHEKDHERKIQQKLSEQIEQPQKILKSETRFRWNKATCGQNIQLYDENCRAWNGQKSRLQTVLADKPIMYGENYWEIIVDERTQNNLAIGITTTNDINFNEPIPMNIGTGYGYFGMTKIKVSAHKTIYTGKVGVYINMEKGILIYSINDEYSKNYRKGKIFSKGPLFPAVSIACNSGCTIVGPLPCPQSIKDYIKQLLFF